jgi:hypothetical protein
MFFGFVTLREKAEKVQSMCSSPLPPASAAVPPRDARHESGHAGMTARRVAVLLILLLASFDLASCKSLPGGDGEYATYDRGQNNRGSP